MKTRHAGSEPAWARFQPGAENLCPAVFSSQVPERKKTGGREGRDRSLKRKRCACAERRDWCSRSESNQNQRARHPHGLSPGRKHTRCDRHRRAGLPCTSRSNGAALERRFALLEKLTWSPDSGSERDRNCCDAGARWRRISRADRGRWVLLRGVSTASRLLWISVDEVVVAEGEKIWGSYGETTAYIARCPARFGGNIGAYRRHRFVQLRCRPIGSFSTPARTNSRAVSLRD